MSTNETMAPTSNEKFDFETLSEGMNRMSSSNRMKRKIPWYYAPAFLLFWFVLFFAVVFPVFYKLPDGLTIENEAEHPNEFIAERAQRILYQIEQIGERLVGSHANENITVQFLLDEVEKVRSVMQSDIYDLEVDLQVVSGAYMHWTMINMYQSVQNLVVKLSTKSSSSQSYLLLNGHFDSKPGSPGVGDDGAMVANMLEILRVLATNRETFHHPIVFLFNGAEENPLQASHGFITQHKWAKNCKALINLESAGSGHKEILFQSGPNHPWLLKYYRQHFKRPYATSMAEELFQAGAIPSDTDFRIFRDFGSLPGLDFAHSYNGYVYHTKYDGFDVIPRGNLQYTGENMLGLVRGLANAPEMEDTAKYAKGHTVFYDFMGLFFVYYTETAGIVVNICLSVIAVLVVGASLWRMAVSAQLPVYNVLRAFGLIFLLHLVGFILAFGLPLLMGVLFDSGDRSMTYFSNKWLVIGLFVTPSLIGLCMPTLLYLNFKRFNRRDKLSQAFKLYMVLHSHSIILAVLCIITTSIGFRSSYLLMIALLFYTGTLLINLITTLHEKGYFWTIVLLLGQIMPFLYFTHLTYSFLCTLTPMTGRYLTIINPDLLVGLLCALGTVLSLGFVIPLLNMFRRPKLILLSLVVITFIFSMIALTPVGFPYRVKTSVGRVHFLHVRRVFYEYDKSVSKNESGYYFDFQDRRIHHPIEDHVDMSKLQVMNDDCEEMMMCGLPLFNHRWSKARREARWLPSNEPLELPGTPLLKLLNRTTDPTNQVAFYEFELSGPPHMSIFLLPRKGVSLKDWSFIKPYLESPEKYEAPPYHIFFSYGKFNTPLKFFFEFKKNDNKFNEPLFELGISGHYLSWYHKRSPEGQKFIKSFPDFIHIMEWPSSYERYIF